MSVHARGGLRDKSAAEMERLMARPKALWPSWRYGPNDQSAIFQNEDEVPEGWKDHPSKVGKDDDDDGVAFRAGHVADDDDVVKDLMRLNHRDLVDILNEYNSERDEKIEFLDTWPKAKLAKTIVLNDAVPAKE